MRVLRATAMGMCFGVLEALERTRAVVHPENVTVLGELVHNDQVATDTRLWTQAACGRRATVKMPSTILSPGSTSSLSLAAEAPTTRGNS